MESSIPARFFLWLLKVENFIQMNLFICKLKGTCSSPFEFQPSINFVKRQLDSVLPKKWFQLRTIDVFIFEKFTEMTMTKFAWNGIIITLRSEICWAETATFKKMLFQSVKSQSPKSSNTMWMSNSKYRRIPKVTPLPFLISYSVPSRFKPKVTVPRKLPPTRINGTQCTQKRWRLKLFLEDSNISRQTDS